MNLNIYTDEPTTTTRQAVIHGLAAVGFLALVVSGIWLAVYSTRFVPVAADRIGAAAVYLGSVFSSANDPALLVVSTSTTPTASTTISFGAGAATSTDTATTPSTPNSVVPTVGGKTDGTYKIEGPATSAVYGLSDLVVNVSTVGYLATASTDSFVASATVPAGSRPAVKFTIKNIGTNWTGTWRFSASIPTRTTYLFQSAPQQSLAPGDSIDYTLGFDRANSGSNQPVLITVNFDSAANESNSANNTASANLTVLGS